MISANGLSISLGGQRVVTDLSIELGEGEMVALVGPNGAGKSSALKALAGVTPLAAGEILIDGVDARRLSLRARARCIAWLPQARPVAWNLAARDVVSLGRFAESPAAYDHLGVADRQAVDAALAKADATHLAARAFHTLSGGEQARVHLARLLASPAPCLLLDEPCAALDIVHQLSLMETLAAEAASSRAILVVLHDLELAARYCQRIMVMEAGHKVADDSAQDALNPHVLEHVFSVRRDAEGRLIRAS